MKKLVLAVAFIAGFAFTSNAQEISENALGLRLGGGNGFGAEFTYQRHLQENNRLEVNLGLRNKSHFNSFKLNGLYQWVWHLEDNFNWYAGVGAGLGNVSDKRYDSRSDGMFAFVTGDIGIEYKFDIPLQIFLDFRPEIALVSYDVYNSFGPDLALGVRYTF